MKENNNSTGTRINYLVNLIKNMTWIWLLISVLEFSPVFAKTDGRLHLKKADVLESVTQNEETILFLKGNVVFEKDSTTITCARAQFNRRTEQVYLAGNVIVTKMGQTLTCDSLHFDSNQDIMIAYGNTHAWDSTYNLISDTLFYYNKIDSGLALGNVILSQDNQIIEARIIEYIKETKVNGVSYIARHDVIIREGGRIATCGEAIYDRSNGRTSLRINPKITEDRQTITGSEIYLQYENNVLKTMYIPDKAHVTYPTSGWRELRSQASEDTLLLRTPIEFVDDMTGNKLRGFFKDGILDSMRLEGMATTLYHIFEDSVYKGRNTLSGDSIIMNFKDQDLHRIFIFGGSRGLYTPDSTDATIGGPVAYSSHTIDYKLAEEETDLHGEASIDYTRTNLTAGYINVSWKTDILKSYPKSKWDSTYATIYPTILEEGKDPMVGDTIVYNMRTRHGRVVKGKTKAEDGYYRGKEIRNRGNNIFYIEESIYTTCELDEPHFHFESKSMKMINNDKVIVRPIVLYVSNIPLFGLPFGVFPHKKGGRHSGWIMPGYGESSTRGQYFDGLGYFWALNDYTDTKFTMTLADRQGITMRLNNNYKKRYFYSGGLFLESRQNFPSGLTRSERDIGQLNKNRQSDYVVRWNHSQTMRNAQSFRVDASYYSSGDYNRRTGIDQSRRLNQQAVSNATYSKRWIKSSNSINLNLSSTRDLMVDKKIDPNSIFYEKPSKAGMQLNITNNTLPQIAFSHSQRDLFPTKAIRKKWYNNIKYNYSSRFNNRLRTYYESEPFAVDDSTEAYQWKRNSAGDPIIETFSDYILGHTSSINVPQKIFRYITLNPSLSIRSDWVNRTFTGSVDSLGKVTKKEVLGFAPRTTGSFNLSMNTQIFGMFPIRLGRLQGVRHVFSPSISYSYTPDFSKQVLGKDLGYFERLEYESGDPIYFDRFTGTLARGTPKNERQTMTFSLNNVFQAKVLQGDKEEKIDLFSWRLSTGHNFVAEQFKWSQLRSSLRTSISKNLKLDMSMSHDFYKFDRTLGRRVDVLRTNRNGLVSPRLLDVNLSTNFRFKGGRLSGPPANIQESDTTTVVGQVDEPSLNQSFLGQSGNIKAESGSLWSTNVSFRYKFNNSNPLAPSKTFFMSTHSTIQVTRNWRVQYNAQFDLIDKNLVTHDFSIYRDLHCWELSLKWRPSGYASGLYFRLNVKSPTLRDLKIEQRGGVYQRPFN